MKATRASNVCDHTSVGILVWRDGKLLLIERKRPPFGLAPPAGHVDDHGSFEDAARDELKEETGLHVEHLELIAEGTKNNPCRRLNGIWHNWKVYRAEASGDVHINKEEVIRAGWFSKKEIQSLMRSNEENAQNGPILEPVWKTWFIEIDILKLFYA